MRRGVLAPAVIVIVLGILGMHGVDAHGMDLHGAMAHADAATSSAPVTPVHEAVATAHPDSHSTTSSVTSGAGQRSGDASGMTVMAMVCVAMLAGAAAALLDLIVRRGRPPKVWDVRQPAPRTWRPDPRVLCLGTGPPTVWRFSVIRC